MITFILCQMTILGIAPVSFSEVVTKSFEYTGLEGWWPDYPRIFNKWVVANGFLPLFLMITISIFAFLDTSMYFRLFQLLVVFGWLHWIAWLFRAPIAHLRYFWPTLIAFGIPCGFGIATLYVRAKYSQRQTLSSAALAIALGFSVMGLGNGIRSLLHGEANIITWEWSRETPLSTFRWIRNKPGQEQMAKYLSETVQKGQEIGVVGVDLEMELLSGAKIVPFYFYADGDKWKDMPLPKKILITPMIGHYLYLDPALASWMEKNLKLEKQFGRYALYNVVGNYPDTPAIFHFSHTPNPKYPLTDSFL
jgi:hypothetical protein